jgi:pyruvate/2-oxoglutarate dehydrogenase complex dihydrolipoamide dehydrogenase (E3) component
LAEGGGGISPAGPNTRFLHGVVELDNHGFIKTGGNLDTSLQGVFAAGQVRAGFAGNEGDAEEDGATAAWIIRGYLGRHGIGVAQGESNGFPDLPAIRAINHKARKP